MICSLGHTRRDPAPPSPSGPAAEDLAGLLERITFHNAENGFCVLRPRRGQRGLIEVIGHAAMISADEWVQATGLHLSASAHAGWD